LRIDTIRSVKLHFAVSLQQTKAKHSRFISTFNRFYRFPFADCTYNRFNLSCFRSGVSLTRGGFIQTKEERYIVQLWLFFELREYIRV